MSNVLWSARRGKIPLHSPTEMSSSRVKIIGSDRVAIFLADEIFVAQHLLGSKVYGVVKLVHILSLRKNIVLHRLWILWSEGNLKTLCLVERVV